MKIPNDLFFEHLEAMLAEGRTVELRVRGHSMRPLLRDGRSVVLLRPYPGNVPDRELRPGDVVLFRHGRQHVLHRIERIEGDRLTLAGDGNCRIREECNRGDVAGVMVGRVRRDGSLLPCASLRWRLCSQLWLGLSPWLRRQLLRAMWHAGIR